MATIVGNLITLDGSLTDWPATSNVVTANNAVTGYNIFGVELADATLGNTYVIGIQSTAPTDPIIGVGTTIWLNTDQNAATGLSPGVIGGDYYVQMAADNNFYLYNSSFGQVSTAALNFSLSTDGKSAEIAVPQSLVTPAGGTAPHSINFVAEVTNATAGTVPVFLPGTFTPNNQYTITDPTTLTVVDHAIKKIAIVWSDTTFNQYFSAPGVPATEAQKTAYSDLFMAAQHQAEAAGVSYDILTEADLTNVGKLSQYSALVFPDMQYVQSSQASAIESALHQVVYNYHVPIITSGNFMTNDQSGAALPATYAAMQDLLNVTNNPAANGNGTGQYAVVADPTALASHNTVVSGYSAGQHIGGASGLFAGDTPGYYNTGYASFVGYSSPTAATTVADINVGAPGANPTVVLPGIIQTTTGGTNTIFATNGLMADSNVLQHAIQNAVFGTAPALTLDTTRFAGIVAARMDMDQSQFQSDVSPATGTGIYAQLIPILQQWKAQFNFVETAYINIGNGTSVGGDPTSTNWAVSAPYYNAIMALGGEIGNHSYTHLLTPPTLDANGNPVPPNTLSPAALNLWAENTNYLYTTPPANGSAPNFTYAYEFGTSKIIEQQNLGITIAGAAVPGMPETIGTSQNILQYYATANGLTGYVSGGWTGVGSGYPNAFGYMTPGNLTTGGSIYLAPNMTFDFTEVEFQKKSNAQALQDWINQFDTLSSNSAVPTVIWPIHDYGATAFDFGGSAPSPYTTAMYTAFIAYAAGYDVTFDAAGNPVIGAQVRPSYEFVTAEELAARIAAQQRAIISETNPSANTITASVTPGVSTDDLGTMAVNLTNGNGQVIQNAGNWYAYDTNSIFLGKTGISNVTVTLGTVQDDVTHIDALPMRADLQTVSGNGSNLAFSMTGDGVVDIHVKTPGTSIVSVQGAPSGKLTGTDLSLTFNDGALAISTASPQGVPVLHNVTITEGATAILTTGTNLLFGGSAPNQLTLTGIYENYIAKLNADGSDTVVDTRAGTPDGTDVAYNFQTFAFVDGLSLTASQLAGIGVVLGTAAADTLTNAIAGEILLGLAGDDTLTAGAANQTLDGGSGNNVMNDGGNAGVTLIGDGGSDTFVITNAATKALEMAGTGMSTVDTNLSTYVLPTNIRNLVYTGTTGINVTGNAQGDLFSGFRGNSTIVGGSGIDTVNFTGAFSNYKVTVNADGSETFIDTRRGSPDGTVTISKVEFFHFSDGLTLTPSQLGGGGGGTVVTGTAGNDILTSTVAGALIQGLAGQDTLTAGAINQTLDGGTGRDILNDNGFAGITLVGSGGNDIYIVSNPGTIITELAGNGTDTLETTLSSYSPLPGGIDKLTYIGTGSFTATANVANETITGAKGADNLGDGGLTGIHLVGGGGADIFTVTSSSTVVTEIAGSAGSTVQTNLSAYTLTANVQNLTFTGTGNFTGHGNGLANTFIVGGSGAHTLTGGAGADTFDFVSANNTIGQNIITDFSASARNANHDVLDLAATLFAPGTTAVELLAGTAHNAAGGLVTAVASGRIFTITIDAADTITVQNINVNQLKAAAATDIHFV